MVFSDGTRQRHKVILNWWFITLSALLLAGCGYNLRKAPEIADRYQPVVVISKYRFDPVYQAMTARLRQQEVAISDTIEGARSRLEIFDEREPERETLISTTPANEELFVMQWQFRFFERDSQGQWNQLIPDQFISASKVVNEQQLEQQIGQNLDSVRRELRQELADKIMQQINSFRIQIPSFSLE